MKASVLVFLLVALCAPVYAVEDSDSEASSAVPEARTWVSRHGIDIGGRNHRYTATAGTMLMRSGGVAWNSRKPVT